MNMTPIEKIVRQRAHKSGYGPALTRLDTALAENTPSNNYERIRLMRMALFAEVDRLQASGKLVLPK
jgi:hypothetical protein